jgi:hypothetical protein
VQVSPGKAGADLFSCQLRARCLAAIRRVHARSPRVTSGGDGTGQLVKLGQVDLHQAGTDPIAGEPALRDVAVQRPCGDVGVGRRSRQADELARPFTRRAVPALDGVAVVLAENRADTAG